MTRMDRWQAWARRVPSRSGLVVRRYPAFCSALAKPATSCNGWIWEESLIQDPV